MISCEQEKIVKNNYKRGTRKKTKIIFVLTNVNAYLPEAYSQGLAILMACAEQNGYHYDVQTFNSYDDLNDFFVLIEGTNPNVIAYTSVSSQFTHIKKISTIVKEKYKKDIIQVCGGVHTTLFPNSILDAEGLDGVFVGEGEYVFIDFLNCIEKGLSYKDVNNFSYRDNGSFITNQLNPLITNLDDIPFAVRDKYNYKNKFLNLKRIGFPKCASFYFIRGCPYKCTYCSNHGIADRYNLNILKQRHRSPGNCIQEIKTVMNAYDIDYVYISDDTFGIDKKWTHEFCELYASQIKLPFQANISVNVVTRELLTDLKNANCVTIGSNVESGNDYIRNKVMKRNMSRDKIIKTFELYKDFGFNYGISWILGVPQETEETIWETIKLNRILKPTNSRANIFYPYKGTVLGNYCFKENLVDLEVFNNFSEERKDTVLKFEHDPGFKNKLLYYQKNFRLLSHRFGRIKTNIYNFSPKTYHKLMGLLKMTRLKG